MKQYQFIEAYKALNHLSSQVLPIRTAYALHKLRRAISPAWEFQVNQEKALIEKLGGLPQNGANGVIISFGNPDDPDAIERANQYKSKMLEIAEMEINDVRFEPVHINMDDTIDISINEIEALDGFVVFEEGPMAMI